MHTASTASSGLTFLHERQCPHHHIPLIHCIHWFELFAPKTMSPPPYITIQLHPLHTASTASTFFHQRTMSPPPYTTYPMHTASTASSGLTFFCTKDNVPTTVYHYSTASTAYCIHCVPHPLGDCIHYVLHPLRPF